MSGYRLVPSAIDDLNEILLSLAEHAGWNASMNVEEDLFAAFERLGQTPGLGHRRPDLTPLPLFFYTLDPYLLVYLRDAEPVSIVAVLHSSRNVRKLLRARFRK
jgi:plasmid stabilization system protein ParE